VTITADTANKRIKIASSYQNSWREVKAYNSSNNHNLETALSSGIGTSAL
jgi:hypothetical protein